MPQFDIANGCSGFGFTYKSRGPDGLSDGSELNSLVEIDHALSARLLEECDAILSSSITTEGRREFYYYGGSPVPFENAVANAMAPFDEYRFEIGVKHDPQWHQYLTVLYPPAVCTSWNQ
jgi:hypothetical protein